MSKIEVINTKNRPYDLMVMEYKLQLTSKARLLNHIFVRISQRSHEYSRQKFLSFIHRRASTW